MMTREWPTPEEFEKMSFDECVQRAIYSLLTKIENEMQNLNKQINTLMSDAKRFAKISTYEDAHIAVVFAKRIENLAMALANAAQAIPSALMPSDLKDFLNTAIKLARKGEDHLAVMLLQRAKKLLEQSRK